MPQIPRPVQQVPSTLAFNPDWVSDPGPEIWQIVRNLDPRQQTIFAGKVLDARIGVQQAQLDALRKVQSALDEVQH
ncbi:MAG: hypothetical protein ACLGI5_09830 [Thermoleophilia bacterium]